MMMEGFSLPTSIGWRGVFFNQVQLHLELADLAFKRRDVHLIFGDDTGFSLFIIEFAAIELRQLDKVGRDTISALRITGSNDAVSNILAKLQLERCRVPPIWTSGFHEPSPFKAHKAYQFFVSRGPARGVHSIEGSDLGGNQHPNIYYYIWVARRSDRLFVIDTGFGHNAAAERGRVLSARSAPMGSRSIASAGTRGDSGRAGPHSARLGRHRLRRHTLLRELP